MAAPPVKPEPAKQLLPFLQRADELQKHDLLVAYYCRLYAMELGLKIPVKERTKATNALLVSLINQLEKDKKVVKLSPEDNLYMEGFALSVFSKADKQDRAGRADLNTAKTFYAASIFFDVLHQFGELQPDIEQKAKYSVWKAADIRKALGEGRKPVAGGPGGDQDFSANAWESQVSPSMDSRTVPAELPPSDADEGSIAVRGRSTSTSPERSHSWAPTPILHNTQTPLQPSGEPPCANFDIPLNHLPSHHRTSQASEDYMQLWGSSDSGFSERHQSSGLPAAHEVHNLPLQEMAGSSYHPPPERIAEAQKSSRYAVSALAFDDVPTAVSFLKRSLELLTSASAVIQ